MNQKFWAKISGGNGLVERAEIVTVIKCLMEEEEGKKMRERMNELKEAAINAIKEDGSSTRTLSQLALKWKSLGAQYSCWGT